MVALFKAAWKLKCMPYDVTKDLSHTIGIAHRAQ
jgi:hypothetical protein